LKHKRTDTKGGTPLRVQSANNKDTVSKEKPLLAIFLYSINST